MAMIKPILCQELYVCELFSLKGSQGVLGDSR